jgi:ABC-type multidrug transport system ATPase subunit
MKITLENTGKRYNQEWIFRGVNDEFKSGEHVVLLGANGSGKSTLLQTILGSIAPSEGKIIYKHEGKEIDIDDVFRYFSFASPYMELPEEFTLTETLQFHTNFKPFLKNLTASEVLEATGLTKSANKQLKYFSSGMKQRVKLALCIFSDTPVALLDEPLSNLDSSGVAWYKNLVNEYSANRLFIVCSNKQVDEYFFCKKELVIEDYKRS